MHGVLRYKRQGQDEKVQWAPPSALRRIDLILIDEASQYDKQEWEHTMRFATRWRPSPKKTPAQARHKCLAFAEDSGVAKPDAGARRGSLVPAYEDGIGPMVWPKGGAGCPRWTWDAPDWGPSSMTHAQRKARWRSRCSRKSLPCALTCTGGQCGATKAIHPA